MAILISWFYYHLHNYEKSSKYILRLQTKTDQFFIYNIINVDI